MGQRIETLTDLLRPGLRIVCVGINPSPRSVEYGHYYQGALGQRFFQRLERVGLLPSELDGWKDDAAFRLGIGFTDIVKRPTPRARDVTADEMQHGRVLLEERLRRQPPELILFTFKRPAVILLGRFAGNGLVGLELGGTPIFVMPGPYCARDAVEQALGSLRTYLNT